MEISFFMAMIPPTVTAQEKKITTARGKPRVYEDETLKAARQKFIAYLGQHRPDHPLVGPVHLTVKWLYPLAGGHKDGEYKTSKPDTDNAIKLLKDCMTKVGFWADDAQVASEFNQKFWAAVPGIYIKAEELPLHG